MKKIFLIVLMILAMGCDPDPAPDPDLYKLIIDFSVRQSMPDEPVFGMTIDYRVGAGEEVSLYVPDTHFTHEEMIEDGTVIYARNLPNPISGNAGIIVSADGILFGGGNCPGEALWMGNFNAEYTFGK